MSGWLLMGLPGAIYLTGVGGDGWIAIGLFIGTTLNWLLIATKLRRYTIRANNSVTLPTYFENRFHDEKKVLMTVSSITIVVFSWYIALPRFLPAVSCLSLCLALIIMWH